MPLKDLILGIDHIGVCVDEMDGAAALWTSLLGTAVAHRECVDAQKTEAAFYDFGASGATVELVAPLAGNTGLVKFLDKRGNGLHHLAFTVSDLGRALAALAAASVPLIDREPRQGARGHRVAFLHPRATNGILVELVEHGHASRAPTKEIER